jgi:hypothetical protein
MSGSGHPNARARHTRFKHPVIDADGHWLEYMPLMRGEFTFANAVRFWGEVNPDFFKGTSVEKVAAEVLAPSAVRA